MRRRAVDILDALALAALVSVGLLGAPGRARADGAFPDSMSIFLPAAAPDRAILATNFGLLVSEDEGASWRWVCEQAIAAYVSMYQQGPPPELPLYAVTSDGLSRAPDGACQWTPTAPAAATVLVSDAFPDPSTPGRVLTIGRATTATASDALYESIDGAATLGRVIWTARRGDTIESVEVPRTAPEVVYLTLTATGTPKRPRLLRSSDRGRSFVEHALGAALGDRRPLTAAVDPEDPSTLYLRVRRAPGEAGDHLALTRDGGRTATIAATLEAPMTGFLRGADGTLYALSKEGSVRSTDGGRTFLPWATQAHLRALGERGGRLYGVADAFMDGFAVGTSVDGGATWVPLLRYQDIAGVLECPNIQAVCAQPWEDLQVLFGIGPAPPPQPVAPGPGCACTSGPLPARPAASELAWWGLVGLCLRARGARRAGRRCP